jgi:hypothetical protein
MLLGIAIMIAFIPSVVGAVVPTAWAVMWLAMPVYLFKCKIKMTTIHWLGLLFLSYASISLIWSPHGTYDLLQWFAIASVFVWSAELKDIKPIVVGLAIGLIASDVVAILQYFDVNLVFKFTHRPAGLFINSNIFAETSGMMLILILIYKLYWFIPVTIPGLMVSSRAVILGLSAAFLVWAWKQSKILALSISGIGVLIVSQIGLASSTSDHYWLLLDTLSGITLSGHGIGSFAYDYPLYAKHIDLLQIRYLEAHNDILQLIFELGIGAIPLFILIFKLLKVDDVRQCAYIFFIVTSAFAFPLHQPITAFIVALVAGQLVRNSLDYRFASYNSRSVLFNRLATQ